MSCLKYDKIFRHQEIEGYAKVFNQEPIDVSVKEMPKDIKLPDVPMSTEQPVSKVVRVGDIISRSKDQNKKKPYLNQVARPQEPKKSLNELMAELNDLIGLSDVKKDITSMINLVRVNKMRADKGLKSTNMSLHLVFTGNPGTGKTTVARLIGKIYKEIGILSKGHFKEADRGDLVAGYVGQTALKVKDVVEEAMGGILFIDEAYSLYRGEDKQDFGTEAIDALLKLMEDNREDLIVIVAGYEKPMDKFLKSNPGLQSRFNKYIQFEDYTEEEMSKIFELVCNQNHYKITNAAKLMVERIFASVTANKTPNFANARLVRNLFEKVIIYQSNRIIEIEDITVEDLQTIEEQDILEYIKYENILELN